jgi:hypothetical protein
VCVCVVYLLYKSEREILKEEVIRRKEERRDKGRSKTERKIKIVRRGGNCAGLFCL